MAITLPDLLIHNIKATWGSEGSRWLEKFPAYLRHYMELWQLSALEVYPNLSYHFVASGKSNGEDIVLKLGVPNPELWQETQALLHYAGQGAVKLLRYEEGALLMQCAVPGITLKSYFPDREGGAITVAAHVMQKLHALPLPQNISTFPMLSRWLAALYKEQPIPTDVLAKARMLAMQLMDTQSAPVLLHGDLHHDNILSQGNNWVAIDPKGVIGELAFEVGAFIRNPIPGLIQHPHAKEIMHQRLSSFANLLGLDRQRILEWSFVQAVLSACWSCEDNTGGVGEMLACAAFLDPGGDIV